MYSASGSFCSLVTLTLAKAIFKINTGILESRSCLLDSFLCVYVWLGFMVVYILKCKSLSLS